MIRTPNRSRASRGFSGLLAGRLSAILPGAGGSRGADGARATDWSVARVGWRMAGPAPSAPAVHRAMPRGRGVVEGEGVGGGAHLDLDGFRCWGGGPASPEGSQARDLRLRANLVAGRLLRPVAILMCDDFRIGDADDYRIEKIRAPENARIHHQRHSPAPLTFLLNTDLTTNPQLRRACVVPVEPGAGCKRQQYHQGKLEPLLHPGSRGIQRLKLLRESNTAN